MQSCNTKADDDTATPSVRTGCRRQSYSTFQNAFAICPSAVILPFTTSIPLMAIHNEVSDQCRKSCLPLSLFAIPMATPLQRSAVINTALPTLFIMIRVHVKLFRAPRIFWKSVGCNGCFICEGTAESRSRPATGRIAMGSIKERPTRCKLENLVFHVFSPFLSTFWSGSL